MNNCADREIREMLPDLLHRTLRSEDRERVELHVATCETCREDLAVLRAVKDAAVFAPAIDVGQIVSRIPPYAPIPAIRAPARSRVTTWLVAATAAVLVVGGGSLLLNGTSEPQKAVAVVGPAAVAPAHTFALAADVASLSDGDLVQLMNEMDDFDALPAVEPDPVISVDSMDSL